MWEAKSQALLRWEKATANAFEARDGVISNIAPIVDDPWPGAAVNAMLWSFREFPSRVHRVSVGQASEEEE